jgi:putative restriction endonuclease
MKNRRQNWTRDELIIAFNYYCKTPFGRFHNRNPEIISLARLLGRTPSALAWKLSNFARLDPSLQHRGVSGATHGAKADIHIWEEFRHDWEALAYESEQLMAQLRGMSVEKASGIQETDLPREGKEREAIVRVRVNQRFFRNTILSAYDNACCITGLAVPELLVASHISRWADDVANRMNPSNGLCLNALHDQAFEKHLLTIDGDNKVCFANRLLKSQKSDDSLRWLVQFEGVVLRQPNKFIPDPALLAKHRQGR